MKLLVYLGFLFVISLSPASKEIQVDSGIDSSRDRLRIMWYNVENLYNPENDTLAGDDEFTPEGLRHWTYTRYRTKLTRLAKVIVAAGQGNPPDLIGLCEIEDACVLEDLISHPILSPYHYRYVHQDSPDHRGMDVVCLYRKNRIDLTGWEVFQSGNSAYGKGTRDFLHIWGVWAKKDSLNLFLVHFISKYGGAGATAEARKKQVSQLVHLVDSVLLLRRNSLLVLAGDFNEEMEGYSMSPLQMSFEGEESKRRIKLEGHLGSYKYKGRWSQIDQFFACGQLIKFQLRGSLFEPSYLLSNDDNYGGMKPYRCYLGYSYQGGLSDHLPILLDINVRSFQAYSEQ